MTLVFLGAEGATHRRLLAEMNVPDQGVSFYRMWSKGLSMTKPYLLADRFPAEAKLYLDSGFTPAAKKFGAEEAELYFEDLLSFVRNNVDRLTAVQEFWFPALGNDWRIEACGKLAELVGDRLWPVWDHSMGLPALSQLSSSFQDVAVTGASVEAVTSLAARVASLKAAHGTRFHALSTAKPDNLRAVQFSSASTMSWLSPMMRGETIVWDGSKLVRYRKDDKARARVRYKRVIEQAGLDFQKILDDDSHEVTRLAIWSYLQMDKNMTERKGRPHLTVVKGGVPDDAVNKSENPSLEDLMELLGEHVDNSALEVRKSVGGELTFPAGAEPRDPGEIMMLPGFGVETRRDLVMKDGEEKVEERILMTSQPGSVRVCDTCFVSANCPAMKPGSMCAFKLPVSVRTKEELKSLLNAVIEMQGARVAFMKYAEDLSGGYADPNTSQEMDRLFKLVETVNKLESTRDVARITVERETSGGILSAIFGDRAQMLQELPNGGLNESQTTRIIDGEVE